MPESSGIGSKNSSSASRPPAEAPMPTIGNVAGSWPFSPAGRGWLATCVAAGLESRGGPTESIWSMASAVSGVPSGWSSRFMTRVGWVDPWKFFPGASIRSRRRAGELSRTSRPERLASPLNRRRPDVMPQRLLQIACRGESGSNWQSASQNAPFADKLGKIQKPENASVGRPAAILTAGRSRGPGVGGHRRNASATHGRTAEPRMMARPNVERR